MRDLNDWIDANETKRNYATRARAQKAATRYAEEIAGDLLKGSTLVVIQSARNGRWVPVFLNAHPVVAHDFPVWN